MNEERQNSTQRREDTKYQFSLRLSAFVSLCLIFKVNILSKLSYLTFEHLSRYPEIVHGSFSRKGGVSKSPYDGLNVSFDVGDAPASVLANCQLIKDELKIANLIQSKQTHGPDIYIVEDVTATVPPCDALITAEKNVGLMIKHADCQAAIFYDPMVKVIAAVHAGWKGSSAKIYTKTIQKLKSAFGSNPENLMVGISPSLGNAEFKNYEQELPEEFWRYQVSLNHFDFWAIARDELLQAGLLQGHIKIACLCTKSNPKEYFSYRREKITGRMGTVIALTS